MKNRYLFAALLLASSLASCDLDNPEEGIATDDIIVLSFDKDSILANGEDRAVLTATLGELADANQQVTFKTEHGSLPGSDPETPKVFLINTSNKTAQANLQADNVADDLVEISASVGDFKAVKTIRFRRAYPDNLIATPEKNNIAADRIDFSKIDIQLFRDIGVPSVGTKILFEVTELDAATVEMAPFTFSDENGLASVIVKSGNGMPGSVQVKAYTRNQAGNEVSQTLTFQFE